MTLSLQRRHHRVWLDRDYAEKLAQRSLSSSTGDQDQRLI